MTIQTRTSHRDIWEQAKSLYGIILVRGEMGRATWYLGVVSGGNPICSFRQVFAKTYRFATIQNITDDR